MFSSASHCTSFSHLLCFYAHHSTEAVRSEVYSLLTHCSCDALGLRLLLHSILTETASLRARAIEAGVAVLQHMSTTAGLGAAQESVLQSLPSLLPRFSYTEVEAFRSATPCKWCFYRQSDRLDSELLVVMITAMDVLWQLQWKHAWTLQSVQSRLLFSLLHSSSLLESLLRIHYRAAVSLPPLSSSSSLSLSSSSLSPPPLTLEQEKLQPSAELEWSRGTLLKKLHSYPALLQAIEPKLDVALLSELTDCIDNEMKLRSKEDGESSRILSRVELIDLIYLRKTLRSFIATRDALLQNGKDSDRLNQYLNHLIAFRHTEDKQTLKSILTEFHHIVLLAFPASSFLLSVMCVSLPLPTTVIAKKVITNVCGATPKDVCSRTVALLLQRLDGAARSECYDLLKTLITRGLSGTMEDAEKSLVLLRAIEEEAREVELQDFIESIGERLVTRTERVDLEVFRLYHECVTGWSGECVSAVCDATTCLIQDASELVTYHGMQLLLLLVQNQAEYLLHHQYLLLNLLLSSCAKYNHSLQLHATALHLYSVLFPFVDIEDRRSPEEDAEKVKYMALRHRSCRVVV